MEVLILSRLQFAAATFFHFLFVPLDPRAGRILVAIMETKWVRSGDEEYKRMAKFWGKLFIINFALGSGDRHNPGVPVRHQLGPLFGLRG